MIRRPCVTCRGLLEWVASPAGGWWTHVDGLAGHASAPMRCSFHGTELLHEQGGPSRATIHGRWVCIDCEHAFQAALDRLAA